MPAMLISRQFRLVLSLSDLYCWPEDGDDPVLLREWKEIIGLLRLDESRIAALYDLYFDQTPAGQGDVHVFLNNDQSDGLLAFDLYRDLMDQLDIITVGICVPADVAAQIKSLLRSAFDQASCQILYEEGNSLRNVQQMIELTGYPRALGNFNQQLLFSR